MRYRRKGRKRRRASGFRKTKRRARRINRYRTARGGIRL